MMTSIIPALIAFGILLAISLFGLFKSNAAARHNSIGPANFDATGRRDDLSRSSDMHS